MKAPGTRRARVCAWSPGRRVAWLWRRSERESLLRAANPLFSKSVPAAGWRTFDRPAWASSGT